MIEAWSCEHHDCRMDMRTNRDNNTGVYGYGDINGRNNLSRLVVHVGNDFILRSFYSYWIILFVLSAVVFLPTVSYAATYRYVCADWTLNQATCSSDDLTLTYPGAGGYDAAYDANATAYPMPAGNYWLSYDTTQAETRLVCTNNGGSAGCGNNIETGSKVAYPLTVTGTGNAGLDWLLSNANHTGVISNICITDVEGECEEGAPELSDFDEFIENASTTFVTYMGFSSSDMSSAINDNISSFIGTTLGALERYWGWIIALAAISTIVAFWRRAMRFLRI